MIKIWEVRYPNLLKGIVRFSTTVLLMFCISFSCFHSKDRLDTIKYVNEKEMCKKFLVYIEACYSGSMFLNLSGNLGVVAVTVTNDQEPSRGWN